MASLDWNQPLLGRIHSLLLHTFLRLRLDCSLTSAQSVLSLVQKRDEQSAVYSALPDLESEATKSVSLSADTNGKLQQAERESLDEKDDTRLLPTAEAAQTGNTVTGTHNSGDTGRPLQSGIGKSRPSKVFHMDVHLGCLILFLGVFAAVVGIWATRTFENRGDSAKQHIQAGGPLRPSSDYILDPRWNFEEGPRRRTYEMTISDTVLNPDGVFRPMMVIDGRFPGPMIECNEGDVLVVTVHNQASNATSIHWHGIYQNETNHMDGTVGVTQCPIGPNQTFTYEFRIGGQSGTYWYHGHHGLQAADGLFGPLIVHGRDERQKQKLDYSTDRVLMVQDHYHDLTGSLLMEYLQPGQENAEPVPDSSLLNGNNVRNCDQFLHRECDNTTMSLPSLHLERGKRHRLRIINVGTFAEFQFSVDEHEFAVTEVDGTDVLPVYYHRLNITPAQRYSIILSSTEGSSDSYWLRARMITACFAEKNRHLDPLLRAVISYTGEDRLEIPTSRDWSDAPEMQCRDMNTTELVPVDVVPAPAAADAFFYLRSNFEIGSWRLSRGFFNTTSWRPNVHSPLLARITDERASLNGSFKIRSPAAVNSEAFDTNTEFIIQTEGIQTVDVAIQNFDDGNHPMHLHGYKYFVLATGKGHFNATAVYPTLDLSNPLRRDTASLEAYSWLLIRFVADNPGVWALHCHVAWHSEAGLLMNILTRADVVRTWTLPAANRDLCSAQGLERGLGPKDEIWFGHQE